MKFATRSLLHSRARRTVAVIAASSMLLASCQDLFQRGPSADQRAAAVIRRIESVTDPAQREIAAVFTFNLLCTLSRVAEGQADGEVESAIAPHLSNLHPEARARLRRLSETLQAIPSAIRAQLLGSLVAFDPGQCTAAPQWEVIKQKVIFSHQLIPRLRANFCSGTFSYADNTAADRAITTASNVRSNIEGPPSVAPAASPVILGVEGVSARHPALAATASTPIGDGVSPFGVETNIPCSFTNDTCDATKGLICGGKVSGGSFCVAFPVVQKDRELILRGYNFWDVQSARLVFTPLVPGQGLESTSIVSHVDANEPSDGNAACPIASAANPTHNRAHFGVSANEGAFYRLRMYNRNGTFLTQRDGLDDAPPRVLHVCYPPTLGTVTVPSGTIRDCALPLETCPQDGASCAGTWSTPPRKLSDCHHGPGQPVVCGETPEWFANEPLSARTDAASPVIRDPVVFVMKDEPKYEIRTTLQSVECDDETGPFNWPGSDEPMLLVAGYPLDIPPGALPDLIKGIEDNPFAWQGSNYDDGDRRREVKLLSTVGGLNFDSRVVYHVLMMEDDSKAAGIIAGLVAIAVIATLVILAGHPEVASVGTAVAVPFWLLVMDSVGEDDVIGTATLMVTPIAIDERIAADHMSTFLTVPPDLSALPQLEGVPAEKERGQRLIHPFEDSPRKKPLQAECEPANCPSGQTCLVNRCVEPGFADPTAGKAFRERREYWGSSAYYAVDLLWERVQTP